MGSSWAVLLGLWLASHSSAFVDGLYVERVGPAFSRALSGLTSFLPFSVASLCLTLLVLASAVGLGLGLARVARGRLTWRELLVAIGRRTGGTLSLVLALFYLSWGVLYARQPLAVREGWVPEDPSAASAPDPLQPDQLEPLCEIWIEHVNALYVQIHGTEDSGEPTALDGSLEQVEQLLDEGLTRVGALLHLDRQFGVSRGPAKPSFLSPLMSGLGISGFYFPWTGEANYNAQIPDWQKPHVIAHEKVHQRGFPYEDEANFLGFLACALSDAPRLQYSGHLFAQRQLLFLLLLQRPERGEDLLARRHPGVQRDVDAAHAFWLGHQGWISDAASAMNDRYLRLHQVPGGIQSYGRSARLLVLFSRHHDDSAAFPAVPGR